MTSLNFVHTENAFSRLDESNDRHFYAQDRFVSHLDSVALSTVEKLISNVIIEVKPVILDLMAGWDSHLPETLKPAHVVGLGLNLNELTANKALTDSVIHDLNANPVLPFHGATFDVVLNTVSVDYMIHPVEIFQEVARILKPGGLFLVIFSNRMFPQKAVKIWRDASEDERVILVEEFFSAINMFENPLVFVSRRRPRPRDDKYADMLQYSDPIYAVYAEKRGRDPERIRRPHVIPSYSSELPTEDLERRKRAVKQTLRCPYCEQKLRKWIVPDNPFSQTWDNEFMYLCFNDHCPYYVLGWDFMYCKGNRGVSYRLMYNPEKDRCMPIPVPTPQALRDGIAD